ncbi:hypothetical protein TruAng_010766 [Truncatella angustata]|nr:hypothetical protein TruAng_010766 [Truncatella angustata]
MNSKPTIVLVPGAWLPTTAYEAYLSALEQEGYPTLAISYPSFDPTNPATADVAQDSRSIHGILAHLINNEEKHVVLVMHSYGGMPGSSAAKGLSVSSRREAGLRGGIIGLIYIAAFVVSEGGTCIGMTSGKLASWILNDTPRFGLNIPSDPVRMFKHGFGSREAIALGASCKPHATLAFTSAQPPSAIGGDDDSNAWKDRLVYIVTRRDDEVSAISQFATIESLKRGCLIKEMAEAGHMSPFGGQFLEQSMKLFRESVKAFRED